MAGALPQAGFLRRALSVSRHHLEETRANLVAANRGNIDAAAPDKLSSLPSGDNSMNPPGTKQTKTNRKSTTPKRGEIMACRSLIGPRVPRCAQPAPNRTASDLGRHAKPNQVGTRNAQACVLFVHLFLSLLPTTPAFFLSLSFDRVCCRNDTRRLSSRSRENIRRVPN